MSGAQAAGCSPGGDRLRRRARFHPPGQAATPSPSAWRSATLPMVPTRSTSSAAPAGPSACHRRGDRRRHPPARSDRGIFAETAGGVTIATLGPAGGGRGGPPRRAGRRLHHRQRPQDPRRGGRRTCTPPLPSRRPWRRSTPPWILIDDRKTQRKAPHERDRAHPESAPFAVLEGSARSASTAGRSVRRSRHSMRSIPVSPSGCSTIAGRCGGRSTCSWPTRTCGSSTASTLP